MCCVYIRNVQHHIDTAMLKAARQEILVLHIREQLWFRQDKPALLRQKPRGLSRSKLFGTYISLLLKD